MKAKHEHKPHQPSPGKISLYQKFTRLIPADLVWLLLISGIARFVYYSALITTQAVDTATYVNYKGDILKGIVDARRTPVYPYFIKLIGLFGRQNLMDNVVTVQIILSFLSIVVFYKTLSLAFKNRKVIITATLVYGLMLPVINFDKIVITESLSVGVSVWLIYSVTSYLQKPGTIKAVMLGALVFIAIMLRPAFVFLLPVMMVFWLLRWLIVKKDWKMCLSGLASIAVAMLLITGYGKLNKKNRGFDGLSVISITNEMAVIINAGIYDSGNDPEISAAIASNLRLKKDSTGKRVPGINIMKIYPPERLRQFITTCIKNRPWAYIANIYTTMASLRSSNMFTNYAEHKLNTLAFRVEDTEYMIFCITFNLLYFFLIFDAACILIHWFKYKQVPWFNLIVWMLVTGQLGVAITGGNSEYQRLIVAAIPGLILLLFSYIDKVGFALDGDRLKNYRQW